VDSRNALVQDTKSSPKEVVNHVSIAISPVQQLVTIMLRETRRHKLSYEQLKRVFREVRLRAQIEVPRKRHKLIELPTTEQLARFYAAINDPTHRLIFKTLELCGLRISELTNLLVSRCDFQNNQIFISNSKNGKDRIVIMNDKLSSALQLYLSGRNNKYVFESIRHDKFSPRRIQIIAAHYSKKSGVRIHPHLLRHHFATRAQAQGLTQEQVKTLLGHSKHTDTTAYTHLSLSMVKDSALKILNQWDV
jgi:integrase